MPLGSNPRARTVPVPPPPAKVPALPKRARGKWHASTVRWWRTVWTSPWAGIYTEQDRAGLERLALLIDKQARSADGEFTTKSTHHGMVEVPVELTAAEMAAMASLEDRYGLSPRARQVLRWESAAEQIGEEKPAGEAAVRVEAVAKDRRERLRAV